MFVGALNQTIRKYLAQIAPVLNAKQVVIGCSGNFTFEAAFSQFAPEAKLHSNDVSFYSCMAGRWLTGQPLEFEIVDDGYKWLEGYFATPTMRLASILVLLDMLEFDKRNNAHCVRMWELYRCKFDDLVRETVEKLSAVNIRLSSFYEGDVFDHFQRFDDAVFCCYAPTYSGGYERLYKRLDVIVNWEAPHYQMLDDARRDELLDWMRERTFLWYDDRLIPALSPIVRQRAGRKHTVYLYTNLVELPAFFDDRAAKTLPDILLAGENFTIGKKSEVYLERIKTTDLALFKDAFLSKNIEYGQGMWAFVVRIDGQAVGFIEYKRHYTVGMLYLLADFAVHTKYRRMSKLIIALAIAGETKCLLERLNENKVRGISTTAFTNRSVSMKYRGVLNLLKRSITDDGQKFLQYSADFNDLTWTQTLARWKQKHGSKLR